MEDLRSVDCVGFLDWTPMLSVIRCRSLNCPSEKLHSEVTLRVIFTIFYNHTRMSNSFSSNPHCRNQLIGTYSDIVTSINFIVLQCYYVNKLYSQRKTYRMRLCFRMFLVGYPHTPEPVIHPGRLA